MKLFKKACCFLLASVLLASTVCAAAAPAPRWAYNTFDSKHITVNADGHSFDVYTTFYSPPSGVTPEFKTGVWILADQTLPAGTMYLRAYLLNGDGAVLSEWGWSDFGVSSFNFVDTPSKKTSEAVMYGFGEYQIRHQNGSSITSGESPAVKYDNGKVTNVTTHPQPREAFPTTKSGLTYGSLLQGKPDLIAAIGTDGTPGYVLREDFAPTFYTDAARKIYSEGLKENNLIPLYDLEGNQIGEYALGVSEDKEYDPATAEKIQTLKENAPPASEDLSEIQEQHPLDGILYKILSSSLANGAYPRNTSGETYGSVLSRYIVGKNPDLIAVVGDNEISGYVYTRQWLFPTKDFIDVYDLNGNIIDQFTFNTDRS